jgi:hypothetical protein
VKVHVVAPCVLKDPAKHGRQDAVEFAPATVANVPAAHGTQVELIAAPTKVLYEPGIQRAQAAIEDAPVALLNVPEGQAVALTDEAKGQNEPGGQRTGADSPCIGQIAPTGHARQVAFDDAPTELLNEPAPQGVGFTDDSGQNEPAGQMTGAPDEQKKEAGQGTQVSWRMRWFDASAA